MHCVVLRSQCCYGVTAGDTETRRMYGTRVRTTVPSNGSDLPFTHTDPDPQYVSARSQYCSAGVQFIARCLGWIERMDVPSCVEHYQ